MAEKQVERKAMIFGAPIAAIALFAAIQGFTALVPLTFYTTGGGYVSLGQHAFVPLTGLVLGPIAGFIAAQIGGVIGMFLSPGAYPLGLVDSFLGGGAIGLSWGMAACLEKPKWKIISAIWFYGNFFIYWFVPQYLPGCAGGFDCTANYGNVWPWNDFFSYSLFVRPGYFMWMSFVIYTALGLTGRVSRWVRSEKNLTSIVGFWLITQCGRFGWSPIFSWPYRVLLNRPIWSDVQSAIGALLPISLYNTFTSWVIGTAVCLVIVKGLRKTRYLQVPLSLTVD